MARMKQTVTLTVKYDSKLNGHPSAWAWGDLTGAEVTVEEWTGAESVPLDFIPTKGDTVRDRDGDIWFRDGGKWAVVFGSARIDTEELLAEYGPIARMKLVEA